MTANTSKQSSDREKAARFVLAALSHRGPEISELLRAEFLPFCVEGDPEPEFIGPLVAVRRKLKDAIDRVVVADNRLFGANTALDTARRSRAKAARGLGRQISGLRAACSALFVDLPVQELGFDARTAQDPVPLLMQADRVVESLERIEAPSSEHLFEGDDFDPNKYALQIQASAKHLRQVLDEVADARRQSESMLLAKQAITKEYDAIFGEGARLFESFCRLAGQKDLADRIRPSESRPGRTEVEPDEGELDEVPADEASSNDTSREESKEVNA